jgi:hypothetical protein
MSGRSSRALIGAACAAAAAASACDGTIGTTRLVPGDGGGIVVHVVSGSTSDGGGSTDGGMDGISVTVLGQDGAARDGAGTPDGRASDAATVTADGAPRADTGPPADAGPRPGSSLVIALPDAGADRPPGACPDLDGNGAPDCEETLVKNAGFTGGSLGWLAEPKVQLAWKAADADGSPRSGSLSVTNVNAAAAEGTSMGGARQCAPATAGTIYRLAARVFLESGQGTGGRAAVNLGFHTSADCAELPIATYTSPLVEATRAWTTLHGLATAPPGTRSVSVRLVAVKPLRLGAFAALFDDLLLRPR